MLVALLAALCGLRGAGVTTLLAWTDLVIEAARYPLLFGVYVATWLAARGATGESRRQRLLAGSLATAALFDPLFLVGSVAWLAGLHALLPRLRMAFGYVIATYVGAAIACHRDVFGTDPAVAQWGYVLAVGYTFRVAWLLHEVRLRREQVIRFDELLLYFVFAPFFVIVPYMIAIPRFDGFCAGLDRHDPAVERSGLRLLVWGTALSVAAWLVRADYGPSELALASLAAGAYGLAFVHGFAAYFVEHLLAALAIAAILVGLVRVLGIDLGPSFDQPLRAQRLTEWWRRWNTHTHFRDLLVELFYYPVVMRLRRRPLRATVLGCVAVFVVGSTLFHWPKHYFMRGYASFPIGSLAENLVMCALVAGSLVLEQRRAKARVTSPPATGIRAVARTFIRTAITLLLVYLAVGVIGRGVQRSILA